jgi:single-stranded DNA-binding protein
MNIMVKVSTAGHIGRDAETRIQEESGETIATFSLAVRRRDDSTEWVRCSLKGKRAKALAPHLKKGVGVFVAGDVFADAWIDKETKELRSALSVYVTDLSFVTGAKGREQQSEGGEETTPQLEDAAVV